MHEIAYIRQKYTQNQKNSTIIVKLPSEKIKKSIIFVDEYKKQTTMVESHTLAILDDEPLILSALKAELAAFFDIQFAVTTDTEFFQNLTKGVPDLVLLDILLSDNKSGVDVVSALRAKFPQVKILVLSIDNRRETFRRLLDLGIDGFVSKKASPTEVVHAIDTILSGNKYYGKDIRRLVMEIQTSMLSGSEPVLTQREVDILYACCEGKNSTDIGKALHMSPRTVEAHKQTLFSKLAVDNTTELIVTAIRLGIINV